MNDLTLEAELANLGMSPGLRRALDQACAEMTTEQKTEALAMLLELRRNAAESLSRTESHTAEDEVQQPNALDSVFHVASPEPLTVASGSEAQPEMPRAMVASRGTRADIFDNFKQFLKNFWNAVSKREKDLAIVSIGKIHADMLKMSLEIRSQSLSIQKQMQEIMEHNREALEKSIEGRTISNRELALMLAKELVGTSVPREGKVRIGYDGVQLLVEGTVETPEEDAQQHDIKVK